VCTNAYVLERIERYFKILRNFKKDIEKAIAEVEKSGKLDKKRLEKYLELSNDTEMEKLFDYVGIFKIDPKKEILEPLAESLELLREFLKTGDLSLGKKLLESAKRINV